MKGECPDWLRGQITDEQWRVLDEKGLEQLRRWYVDGEVMDYDPIELMGEGENKATVRQEGIIFQGQVPALPILVRQGVEVTTMPMGGVPRGDRD